MTDETPSADVAARFEWALSNARHAFTTQGSIEPAGAA